MLKSCLQAFAVLPFLSTMFFVTGAVDDYLDTDSNGTIACINGEFEKGECICLLGWRGVECSQDCGCNGHSTCEKGVGICDDCQNYTTGQFCDRCQPGTYGSANSLSGCQPCRCNGHEDSAKGSCNSTTGQCFCFNDTEGFNCERCSPGYYGDSRLGGVCYGECQSRTVITKVTSGHFGVPSSSSSSTSLPSSSSQRHCLWILTVHSFDAKKFPLLTLPPVKNNMSLDPIMLTINHDLKVDCPYNNIAIYDGLPSFIAGGYLRKNLGSFCGNNLSSNMVLVANSGYLTLYFERQDASQGFNASYLKLDCPEMCSQSPVRRCLGGICKCAKDHAGPTCSKVICPNKCNESNKKGSCDLLNGRCSCMPGYSQPDCSQSIGTAGNRLIWTTLYDSETANLRPTLAEYLPRMGHSLVSINESLWMFGGYSTEKGDMNDIYAFNLPTSRWEEIDPLQNDRPMARHFHGSATLEDIIYIHGGLNEEAGVLGDFWTFQTSIKKWVKLLTTGDVPSLAGHTLTAISERYLLLIGGYSPSNGFLDKVMEYDSQTLHWRVLDTNGVQPIGIYGHTAVCQPRKEVIYIYGGMLYAVDHVTISSYLFIFKRSTLTWLKLSPDPIINPAHSLPLPRYFHAAVSTDNYMIILGGRSGIQSLESLLSISVYVYKCGAWINFANENNIPRIGIPPDPAVAPSFTKASNGNLYLFGGFNGQTLGRLVRISLPKDICHIFSSSRSYCLRHVGCAFCALYEGGTNKTFCYSSGIPPASCFNPKGASEITSGSPCNHNYFESKRCGQYKNCVDCVSSSSRTRTMKSCKWCSSCQQGRCVPQGVSCESVMGDCPKGSRAISSTKLCPLRTCLASDCEKCLHLDDECVWTRQILRASETSQTLNVKPIFDWTCVQKMPQESSNSAIEYTPPSTCPLKCLQHKSCSDCLESSGGEGGSHECIWSTSLKECMSPSYVKLRCEGGLCARGLIFQGARINCIGECTSFKQSAHCLSRPDCGWCSFNDSAQDGRGVCMVGGLLGPTIGVCQSPEIYPGDQNISLPRDLSKFKSYRWHYLNPPHENECANGHHSCDTKYEDCVDLSDGFLCKCKIGYQIEGKKCKPICKEGCLHGTCVEPNVCQCRFGYVGVNCSIECQCNGHSNCAGVDRLKDCLECQNNTQGPQCQKCKPFHVGNPVNGGKCIECRTYCHGHSEVCLSREFLNKHQGLDLTQITSVQDFSDMVAEGPSSDAICLNCQHNTKGDRCDQCKVGFFWTGESIIDGCRECNCNGHGNTCDPTTGTGCPCHNNTENDRQCIGKHSKKTLPPCWQLQCSKCKEYYLGTPVNGHQCYKQMFLDKEYCFDAENIDGCNIPSHGLQQGRTALFAVQPRYMNVDIRVIIDISEGAADFFLSFKDDTFIINSDKTTHHHQIWLDSSYNFPLSMDTWEDFSSATPKMNTSSSSSRLTPYSNSSSNFLTSSNIDTLSAGTSPRGSLFVIKQHSSRALTTYLRLTDPNELFIVRHLQKRLVLTIPQQVHDLRSTRLYMILKGAAEITNGHLFFRQDQSRIDLFVFFSVFFSCFFLFLSFCVLIWKVKQIFDMRRARRLHAAEIRSMASRPFSSMFIYLDPSDSVDSYEYALSSPLHFNSGSAKKSKIGKRLKDSKDSPKFSAQSTKSDHYLVRPVAVEFTWNGSAAIVTVLIILPGDHTTPVRLSLASTLVMLRGSHQNLAHHQSPSTNNIIGFRNVMRRRHSQYALA